MRGPPPSHTFGLYVLVEGMQLVADWPQAVKTQNAAPLMWLDRKVRAAKWDLGRKTAGGILYRGGRLKAAARKV